MTDHPAIIITPAYMIPPHLVGEIQSKLAYVDEAIQKARVSPTGDQVVLELRQEVSLEQQNGLQDKVQRVVASMLGVPVAAARAVAEVKGPTTPAAVPPAWKPKVQILEDYLDRPVKSRVDPTAELMERGELHQEANGIFALGPLLSRLIEYFEGHFVNLANSFQAQPHRFPTLIPARYMERVGYFQSFPHSLSFVTHLREDLDAIDHFAQEACCTGETLRTPPNTFAEIQTLLSPAVCYHLYFGLADQNLPASGVTATAVGNCFRYESINLTSLERLWNFTMREVIFVGSKEFVLENRETARQRMHKVFEEIGLAYRVESANDPFFIGEFRKQVAFQSAFQLKYEIRARLPFKDSTLAVGSYNYHQDFFGRHLNITLPDGSPAHTGCVAFGLERIAYAFLAQFGLNPANWPTVVREALNGGV